MKALWKGYIVLGQLGIPVRLYSATQKSGVTFVQLHEKDSSPVERPLFCKAEHKEIPASEIIRGVEYEPGKFISFTEQELERTSRSEFKAITIRQFCKPEQIPTSYYEKPYYLTPTTGGERGYALIREGLLRSNAAAIGRYYLYGSDHIGAIKVVEDILVLYQLRFTDELIPRNSIQTPPLTRPSPAEIDMMQAVIERYGGPLHLNDYHDEYTEYVSLLTDRKIKGLPLPRQEQTPAHATPDDKIQDALVHALGQNTIQEGTS